MSHPLVILGAGPAGLAAADAASSNGLSVVLVDENHAAGGQIWRGGPGQWSDPRAARLWNALKDRPNVQFMPGTRVVAAAAQGTLLLESEDGARMLHWERAVVCSGARELLLPFPGWTLPGVTGAGGLQALIKGGMPVRGKRVVVAGTGPLLLAVADTVVRAGGELVAIAEHCSSGALARFASGLALRHHAKFAQAVRLFAGLRRVPYLRGATVLQATSLRGRSWPAETGAQNLHSQPVFGPVATATGLNGGRESGSFSTRLASTPATAQTPGGGAALESVMIEWSGRRADYECDFLACGFGLVPVLEVAALFGCAIDSGKVVVDACMRTSVGGVWAAGESTGIGGVDKALAEGRIAGRAAAGVQASAADARALGSARDFAALLEQAFKPPAAMRAVCTPSTIVCRCEDVRAGALAPHDSWRAAKLQTRVGMGPCQGRVCGAACGFLYGWETGGMRPPVFPACAATLASVGAEEGAAL